MHFTPVNKLWVQLFLLGPMRFLAVPEQLDSMNMFPRGVSWREFLQSPEGLEFRYWLVEGFDVDGVIEDRRVLLSSDVSGVDASETTPWVVDGMIISKALPTLPSVCGQSIDFLRDQIEVVRNDN